MPKPPLSSSPGLFDDQLPPERSAPVEVGVSSRAAPLAERLRPKSLDEVLGQDSVVGPDGYLRRLIESGQVPSLIFWGPPGTGKTTLARVISRQTGGHFLPFSAVTSGIKEIKAVMAEAKKLRQMGRVLLFVDEIHRFNRAQQDAFLPYVEDGTIALLGATTENPSFELNGALLSRCRVVVLEPLSEAALDRILVKGMTDERRGLGLAAESVSEDARAAIAQLSSGDARRALNLLEIVLTEAQSQAESSTEVRVDADDVRRIAQSKTLLYDKSGDEHFNLISALHKSLRESDADAAVYWLVRMLEAGEDPLYPARRMLRFAYEDVGLADPQAPLRAIAAWDTYHRLGSPEGELALVQLAVDLALAPKSVAVYEAQKLARQAVQERPAEPVPLAIRNAPTRLMKDLDYGRDYVYAPHTETGVGGVECLPDGLAGTRFYRPSASGQEQELGKRLERVRALRQSARRPQDEP